MKRSQISSPVSGRTRSKKLKEDQTGEQWISATKTRNYLLKDPLIDWLSIYGGRERSCSDQLNTNTFQNFILRKGIEFEDKISQYLSNNFNTITVSDFYYSEKIKETVSYMKEGIPIIYSAPISNKKNFTYGIIDLLVRSDYLNKIIGSSNDYMTSEEEKIPAPNLGTPFHYVVIDIKFSTLNLCSNGLNLLNTGNNPAYKSQVYIYNEAIGEIQGFTPPRAFIIGRKWKYTCKDMIYRGDSCFEKLGVVDFFGKDSFIPDLTNKAIDWYRDVLENGVHWKLYPPSRDELYPNMNVDSGNYNTQKRKIGEKLGEISMIWQCGIKNRKKAFENNIKSWHDNDCSSEKLGIRGKYKPVVQKIMEINRQDNTKILPKIIKNNLNDWKNCKTNDLFVDFETISDLCDPIENIPSQRSFSLIYMIGVGRKNNNSWEFTYFICQELTYKEEYRIIDEFSNFVKKLGKPPMYYWHAEEYLWKKETEKQFRRNDLSEEQKINIINNWDLTNWTDICKIFKEEPIVVKGCFNFGLKNIARTLKKHNLITTQLESDCKSGMVAMIKAWKCYEKFSDPINSTVMKDVIRYNEFDCRVLLDILEYLRNHHT